MYQIQKQAVLRTKSRRSFSLHYRNAAQYYSTSDAVTRKDAQYLLKRELATLRVAAAVSEHSKDHSTNATTMKILHMIRSFRNRGRDCCQSVAQTKLVIVYLGSCIRE